MFVSVHIPKTAGTALSYILDHGSERAVLYDYRKDYSNKLFQNDQDVNDFKNALPFLNNRYKFIHGHFFLNKYKPILSDALYMTCFRHPIDRIISQYQHIALESNEQSRVFQAIKSGLTVVDFADDDNIRHAHLVHLNECDPEELDYIFLAEDFEMSARNFIKQYPDYIINPWVVSTVKNRVNTKEDRMRKREMPSYFKEPTKVDREKLTEICKDEIEYYKAAKRSYEARKTRILKSN